MDGPIPRTPDTTCSTDDVTVNYYYIISIIYTFLYMRILHNNELTFTVRLSEATHTVTGTVSFIQCPSIPTAPTTG